MSVHPESMPSTPRTDEMEQAEEIETIAAEQPPTVDVVVQQSDDGEVAAVAALEASDDGDEEDVFTEDSDLSKTDRRVVVVTTAALPWRTGTAVNPLMRALYLTRGRPKHYVTLWVPWLQDEKSRKKLYGDENSFKEKKEQEEWIRNYCRTRANCSEEEKNLKIMFWDGIYQDAFGSIFPTVDICSLIPKTEADIAILEEPEHLNWFRVPPKDADEVDTLGWSHKFRHVVGILHTNYAAYIRQYGMGTSLVTAPAINALSSLVVRAYCTRIIRLSATLPSLDKKKEVTCNVHGVRPEFLAPPQQVETDKKAASVYFIGKLIWAKGFDDVLELQERYRSVTGEYFAMDVYGGGLDEKAIRLAFFGRRQQHQQREEDEPTQDIIAESSSDSEEDQRAADIFGKPDSLRSQLLYEAATQTTAESAEQDRAVDGDDASMEQAQEESGIEEEEASPFDILGDLSEKTINTSVETAGAALTLVESVAKTAFGGEEKEEQKEDKKKKKVLKEVKRPFDIVPPRARFKWRRTPVPARFLGVKDHIIMRDKPEHSIFLNMSLTEVLCTTTAEALAMGKFVIVPKHPSNEFFLQFPNCLAYNDIDDCVVKLQYALTNKPEPLTDQQAHMLSWEGATERLYKASGITKREAAERKEEGMAESDTRAAKFHVDASRNSQLLKNLFNGKIIAKKLSSLSV